LPCGTDGAIIRGRAYQAHFVRLQSPASAGLFFWADALAARRT
jgi:hypothetical protein